MEKMAYAPVEWSRLKDIDDTVPMNEADYPCLGDIRDVLRKHGMLDRFGVALLHSHFELTPDEVWVEETDAENRRLIIRPMKRDNMAEGNVGTIWQLREGEIKAERWCRKFCQRSIFGHSKEHNRVG